MSGVYGGFLEVFPELIETITIGLGTDAHNVRGVFIPSGGDTIKRRKYTSGNTALDIQSEDVLYVFARYKNEIAIGDYAKISSEPNNLLRITGLLPYNKAGGYVLYTVQRVTGTTPEKTGTLEVKEPTFA